MTLKETERILTCEVKQNRFRSPLKAKQSITAMIKHLRRCILGQIAKHGLYHDSEVLVDITAFADIIGR